MGGRNPLTFSKCLLVITLRNVKNIIEGPSVSLNAVANACDIIDTYLSSHFKE